MASNPPIETRDRFLAACRTGDLALVRELLDQHPDLIRATNDDGATGLHLAVAHPDTVRLLLERGADPNARDQADHALPLHFAAGGGTLESVRALLEAGSEMHSEDDLHQLGVIGWATVFARARRDVVDLLVRHGGRHHIFSAIALNDPELVRRVVGERPGELHRRLSRFEQEQTPLHYVVAPADGLLGGLFRTGAHYRTLELLLQLGADGNATDAGGRTPLDLAMLRGDTEAMRLLHRAGAEPGTPPPANTTAPPERPTEPASAAGQRDATEKASTSLPLGAHTLRPMLAVPDIAASVAWYRAIGFTVTALHGDPTDFAAVALGKTEVLFAPASDIRPATSGLTLWFETDRLNEVYATLKGLQLAWARATLESRAPDGPAVPFTVDLHTAFYGQREFGVRDPNGVEVRFAQPISA